MRAISEEKSKSNTRKREIQVEDEALAEEKRKVEVEKARMRSKEEELIEAATLLKERSEEVDELYVVRYSLYRYFKKYIPPSSHCVDW